MKKSLFSLVALGLFCFSSLVHAEGASSAPSPHPGWAFEHAREIPIQGGGRIKPLDSFAREIVLFETGSRKFQGWEPIDMLFSQLAMPDAWENYPFIQVSREDVRRQLGLDEKRTRFTPHELISNSVLAQYAMTASSQGSQVAAPIANAPKADPRDQEFKRVFERLGTFRRIVLGEAWALVPPTQSAYQQSREASWLNLAQNDPSGQAVKGPFIDLIKGYQAADESKFNEASVRVKTAVEGSIPAWSDTAHSRISVETRYNTLRPFLIAWILYLCAALVWIVARAVTYAQAGDSPTPKPTTPAARTWTHAALLTTAVAVGFQVVGVAMRCYVAGRPPVTNMYESIIWVSLGQLIFAAILYAIHRQAIVLLVSCVLATIGLIAADSAPP